MDRELHALVVLNGEPGAASDQFLARGTLEALDALVDKYRWLGYPMAEWVHLDVFRVADEGQAMSAGGRLRGR